MMDSPRSSHAKPARLMIFGCGYLGGKIARDAMARGWQVSALTRNREMAGELAALGTKVVSAELADTGWHGDLAGHFEFVVNSVGSAGGGLPGYWQSYVDGTRSILAWAAQRRCGTYVYTGSVSVYPQRGGEVVTEDSAVGKGSDAADPLLEAEKLVRESNFFGRWFILRLSGLYGPGRHYLLDQLRAGANQFPGTGMNRLNLIHRDDAARAVFACLDGPAIRGNTTYNVTSDQAAPKAEVAGWLAEHVGGDQPSFGHDEKESVRARSIRGRSGPVPDRLVSNAKIRRELGWAPQYADYQAGYRQIFAAESKA